MSDEHAVGRGALRGLFTTWPARLFGGLKKLAAAELERVIRDSDRLDWLTRHPESAEQFSNMVISGTSPRDAIDTLEHPDAK